MNLWLYFYSQFPLAIGLEELLRKSDTGMRVQRKTKELETYLLPTNLDTPFSLYYNFLT
jgi:hypothetical protein